MMSLKLFVVLFGLCSFSLGHGLNQVVFDGYQGGRAIRAGVSWTPALPEPDAREHIFDFGEKKILKFDDIAAQEPLSDILTYSNLTFASFELLNVPLAIKSGFISEEDGDCATSKPNALFGSTSSPDRRPARIYVADDKCKTAPGDCPECDEQYPYTFKPVSMQIKPIGYAGPVTIQVIGWEIINGRIINTYAAPLFFKGGGRHIKPFKLCLGQWTRPINVLAIQVMGQIWDDGGVAIDDLEVRF